MSELSVTVERREGRGKGPAGRIRRAGNIPGVLYGDGKDPVALVTSPATVEGIIESRSGMNTIFDLELQGTGQQRAVMIHDIQRDPLTQRLIHVDFVRINKDRKVQVRIHVELEGTPEGVKTQGGFLEFLQRDVGVECLPGDIPNEVRIDVSHLTVGQAMRVADLPFAADEVRVLDDPETVIALVALPAAEREATTTTEGEEEAAEEEAAREESAEAREGASTTS